MHIVECVFCETAKDLLTEASLNKHCEHCHEPYENYIEHCRGCEPFRAYANRLAGRDLLKPLRTQKDN